MKSMNPHIGAGVAAAFVLTAGLALSACGQAATSEAASAATSDAASVATSVATSDVVSSAAVTETSSVDSSDVATSGTAGNANKNTGAAEREALRAAAEEQGLSVFEGTVRIVNGTELCEMAGVEPNTIGREEVIAESTYAILVLDQPTTVQGNYGDGSTGEQEASYIGLGQNIPAYEGVEDTASALLPYNGMHACLAGQVQFPTDVSLPLAPRMNVNEVLYYDE